MKNQVVEQPMNSIIEKSSRRNFLKGVAVGGGTMFLASQGLITTAHAAEKTACVPKLIKDKQYTAEELLKIAEPELGPVRKIMMAAIDEKTNEVVTRPMTPEERNYFSWGENVGLLCFDQFWSDLAYKGNQTNARTYNFPVRLSFVPDIFGPEGLYNGPEQWRGWNLPHILHTARQLQEHGCRVITGACGVLGSIQQTMSEMMDIPVYLSSVMMVPRFQAKLPKGKKVGIMTVSSGMLAAWDHGVLRGCGIEKPEEVPVYGMSESPFADKFLNFTGPFQSYDPALVEEAIFQGAKDFLKQNPDIAHIIFECTDMGDPAADRIRKELNIPVFTPTDLVKLAYEENKKTFNHSSW